MVTSCGHDRARLSDTLSRSSMSVDSGLADAVDWFVGEARARGHEFQQPGSVREVVWVNSLSTPHLIGECVRDKNQDGMPGVAGGRRVEIKRPAVPGELTATLLKFAVAHELGHCLDDRNHLAGGSFGIMQTWLPTSGFAESHLDGWLDQYFNQ